MTDENEGSIPVQAAESVGLQGVDAEAPDTDAEVAEEVRLQEETREAEAETETETIEDGDDEAEELEDEGELEA